VRIEYFELLSVAESPESTEIENVVNMGLEAKKATVLGEDYDK
jgi:hypothetical protein